MSPDTGYEPLMDSRTTILSHSRNDSGATIDKNRLVSARSPATSSSEALDQQPKKPKHWLGIRRWVWFTLFVGFGSAAIAGVIVGVVISHSEGDKLSSSAASSGSGSTAASPTSTHPTVATGKTGDYYKLTNGSTVQFKSAVGGTFDTTGANSARASDTSPALSEAWDFDNDRMIGVNLGGWLSLEPFITPAIFQRFANSTPAAVDEWTLCLNLDKISSTEKRDVYEKHLSTFITESDFAAIAAAGFNWIRLPLPFWAIDHATWSGEPFYDGIWPHTLQAVEWARRYGLRINLDIHSAPGSENGWNHSGLLGGIGFLMTSMGYANAQRYLENVLRPIVQFASTPEYSPVVAMISPLNEPRAAMIGETQVMSLNSQIYQLIRGVTGEGKGPYIAFSDGLLGLTAYNALSFSPGNDRVGVDAHTYGQVFVVPLTQLSYAQRLAGACASGAGVRASMARQLTITGEVTLASTDCGLYLNGVGSGSRYEGTFDGATKVGDCATVTDYKSYTDDDKRDLQVIFSAWQEASLNHFYWTWRIALDANGDHPNPLWDAQLGLSEGWIPADVRHSDGVCSQNGHPLASVASASTTIAPASLPWPPATISGATRTYSYAQTGKPTTLSAGRGNGWANPSDTASAFTPSAGVQYPFAWPTQPAS